MRWIIESEIADIVGLDAALVHDEMLTRYLNNQKQPVIVDTADLLSKLPLTRRALANAVTALKKEKLLCPLKKDRNEGLGRKYLVLSPEEKEVVFGTVKKEIKIVKGKVWK